MEDQSDSEQTDAAAAAIECGQATFAFPFRQIPLDKFQKREKYKLKFDHMHNGNGEYPRRPQYSVELPRG
jgi:hypothetical protein